jgi:hypothetical protein
MPPRASSVEMSVDGPFGSTDLPAFPPPPRVKRKWPIWEHTPQAIVGVDTASRVYPTCGGKDQVGFTRLAAPSITELGQARVSMQSIVFRE